MMLNQSHDRKNPVRHFPPHMTRGNETNERKSFALSLRHPLWNKAFPRNSMERGAITAVLQVPKQRRNGTGQEAESAGEKKKQALYPLSRRQLQTNPKILARRTVIPHLLARYPNSFQIDIGSLYRQASLSYNIWRQLIWLLPQNISQPRSRSSF